MEAVEGLGAAWFQESEAGIGHRMRGIYSQGLAMGK
ncbi:hypothetical protein Achl_4342 (plasmid) [Pseudarthrobacter chlorophenolicus A6]|uniref:Uncharacterized protein n=1 Tax=Pseudarthrobacter chlorophenolicus (strain ATCC 700700 / DSM 12829 / CIP 107037 / JCM 12360 / KCTC 9906 / NCIMB 13794 / A6) TaxID=452863 RepID=B8HIP6_PSECP|nr:hypothetical protein Achl_4342 [Pseudarthrobacter chlorophenolicus A6]